MRLTGVYDLDKINRITLKEYSMIIFADALRETDKRNQAAYSALYNRVAYGLDKSEVSEDDIFDQRQAQMRLFGRYEEDEMDDKQKEVADFIFNINQKMAKGG